MVNIGLNVAKVVILHSNNATINDDMIDFIVLHRINRLSSTCLIIKKTQIGFTRPITATHRKKTFHAKLEGNYKILPVRT